MLGLRTSLLFEWATLWDWELGVRETVLSVCRRVGTKRVFLVVSIATRRIENKLVDLEEVLPGVLRRYQATATACR